MMVDQCDSQPVKAYIMSGLLKKIDLEATSDLAKALVAALGLYVGLFHLEYVDAEYSLWLSWFLTPVIVTFLLPAVIIILIYVSSIIYHLYRLYRQRAVDGVQSDWRQAARFAICALWDAHGWLWHGYEIRGLENMPDDACLVIYYHGALPIDMYYFTARMFLYRKKMVHSVGDRLMFKIPGWKTLLEGLCVIPGTVQSCAGVLRAGNTLAISPGGVFEAQFGDHHYRLHWRSRMGFAKVANEAKVPIVPMFTQNVREAFRTVGWLRGICLRVYAKTRVPLAPVYGGFPVKLITHLGPPIHHDPALSPEQLQRKVGKAIEDLIEEHQRIPGNILLALTERIYQFPKTPKPQMPKVEADSLISKVKSPNAEADSTKTQAESPKGDADSTKTKAEPPIAEIEPSKTEANSPNFVVEPTKTEAKSPNFVVDPSKTEANSPNFEVQSSKTETMLSNFEVQSSKTEAVAPKNETESPTCNAESPMLNTESQIVKAGSPKTDTESLKEKINGITTNGCVLNDAPSEAKSEKLKVL